MPVNTLQSAVAPYTVKGGSVFGDKGDDLTGGEVDLDGVSPRRGEVNLPVSTQQSVTVNLTGSTQDWLSGGLTGLV